MTQYYLALHYFMVSLQIYKAHYIIVDTHILGVCVDVSSNNRKKSPMFISPNDDDVLFI